MQLFFVTRFLFWYGFIFSFIVCTAIGAFIQCWFLINFCDIKSKKSYYIAYLAICYVGYLFGLHAKIHISPIVDTIIGTGILFLFLNKWLKQNYILSSITATLTMAVTTLGESMSLVLEYFASQIAESIQIIHMISLLLMYAISFAIYKFLVDRYSIKSPYKSKYLFVFSLPMFFIAIILRTVNYVRYSTTTKGVILQSDRIQNHEVILLTVIAFSCICIILFAYEKTIRQFQSENERLLLHAQISAQKNYVEEAKQKYETTRAFRHDFANHMIALRGMINIGETQKSAAYLDRFEQISQSMAFKITTGNSMVDILLSEKLSYAEQSGIHMECDIAVPESVKIDDFDLCAIFANAIDNAIKACNSIKDCEKTIDIVAKPRNNFFMIDIINNYKIENVPKGSGIGLATIQTITEKYHGTVEILDADNCFCISVLLPFGND